jgi:hypothetical protein
MLSKESVVFWTNVEHVLYEENGHQFIIEFDLFNNHHYFYHRKDGYYTELARSTFDDIYDAIDKFNEIVIGGTS